MDNERKKIRLDDWDYSTEGVYFITICCHNRELSFGFIDKNKVIFSEIGNIALQCWMEIPKHFSHVKIDEFVIMPNHIHGIIMLDYSRVGPRHGMTLQSKHNRDEKINKFSKPVKNSVSVIINQFKSSVKRWCNQNGYANFKWQSRFYDQILHTEKSIDAIREYIHLNPVNWQEDDLFKF